MKKILEEIKKVFDKSVPLDKRLCIVFALLITVSAFIAVVAFMWRALPALLAVAALLYLLFGNAIERKRLAQINQQVNTAMDDPIIWQELASRVTIPVLSRAFGASIEAEDLTYWGVQTYGVGYYFGTPDSIDDKNQRRQIRLQVARRLSGLVNIPPAQLLHDEVVRCGSNCVYIRADIPAIRQNLLMSARSI